jgi:hypothetical protein
MKPCVPARLSVRARATVVAVCAALAVLASVLPLSAQTPIDIGGWQLRQLNSTQTETFPTGTTIQPGGYLILARFVSQAAFETYYGVTLGANVTYLTHVSSATGVPQINGGETFELVNAASVSEDGPTPALPATTPTQAFHRDDPEAAPWTSIDTAPTPGSGVEAADGVASGVVITEVNDATVGTNAYYNEFVELYYDVVGGGTSNLPPVISGTTHAPSAPTASDSVVVTTSVTDSDGTVVSVQLYARFGGSAFAAQAMTATGGAGWRGVVTPLTGNATLEYYIVAEDDEAAQTRDPANAPTSVFSVWVQGTSGPARVILFDHAHGQDAGTEGNWRIDDNAPLPLPANPTSEAAWSGQLSSWGYELYLRGHTLRSNNVPLDASVLAGVDLLVIVEPQNPFTAAEIAAVGTFVFNGGSLFVVANHNGSDRDADGWDSPSIFGGYSIPHISVPVGTDVETFCGALFGLHFHVKDEGNNAITGTFSNVDTNPTNPIINGEYGHVGATIYHVGNVMSLWPTANPYLTNVGGHIWKDGDTGNPAVNIAAWSRYGAGRVMGYGDSSSTADGTDSDPHVNNWTEAGGNNREFFLNATMWLLASDQTAVGGETPAAPGLGLRAAPNPFNPATTIAFTLPSAGEMAVEIFDLRGQHVRTLLRGRHEAGPQRVTWDGRGDDGRGVASSVYLVRATGAGLLEFTKVVLTK